jgi:glycosyltransferase involved in cell wall biosynthesis
MDNVHWHGRIPYQSAIQLSAAADVLIATYDPAIPNHRYSSPNKVFEAMLLGKPIIVAQDTNMDRIIRQSDCGLVVPYGDITALESALLCLQSDPELRQRLGQNARKAYDSTYSWKIMQDRLLRLYEQVMS